MCRALHTVEANNYTNETQSDLNDKEYIWSKTL